MPRPPLPSPSLLRKPKSFVCPGAQVRRPESTPQLGSNLLASDFAESILFALRQ